MGSGKKNDKGAAPKISDFSQKAIRQAVLRQGLTHPLTLYPPTLAVLSGLAGALFSFPPLLVVALGAGLLGIGSGIINIFLREEALAGKYLEKLNALQAEHEEQVLASLRQNLEKCRANPASMSYALRGVKQFDRCKQKYQNVEDLLAGKLSRTEITFGRFQSAAREVYLSILDNLKGVTDILLSAGTIDRQYLKSRLKELAQKTQLKPVEKKEVGALTERLKLLKRQLARVDDLLARNEEAMTQLEETTSQLAQMNTEGKFASTDLDSAIDYLQELARNTPKYDRKPLAIEKV